MAARRWQLTLIKAYTALILASIAISVISGAQDHDVPVSVDGMRCDSCGSECSVMCGSRNFRICCYNYVKKRSIPSWPSSNGGQGGSSGVPSESRDSDSTQSEQQEISSPISSSDMKTSSSVIVSSPPVKTPLLIKGLAGKHFLRGRVPEMIGGADSAEEDFIFPISLRDLVANIIQNLNAFENKKFTRAELY